MVAFTSLTTCFRHVCFDIFAVDRIANFIGILFTVFLLSTSTVQAGDFTVDWAGGANWPVNSLGPHTETMTDQYGFQLDARMTLSRSGGTALAGTPDDLLTFSGNQFGTDTSIWMVYDAASGSSGIGESTYTATMQLLNGGSAFASDGISFEITDVDSSDNNGAADRCDFITATGNAGNPTLSVVGGSPTVVVGPGSGSGATPTLSANQAQCIYNLGAATSPTSNGDDNGTILASYPAGTHTTTVAYDESIEDVYGVTSRDAANRGSGIWAATIVSVNQSISLVKTTTATSYAGASETITYNFEITNNGPLPILTSQNIRISDDKIGEFTCGTIAAAIPVGDTHTCSANYTTNATDATAPNVTNNATAGVGTGTQSFATRLQSNSDSVTVPRDLSAPSFTISKVADRASVAAAGETISYTITVVNTGGQDLTGTSLSDNLVQGGTGLTLTSGPTLSGDTDSDAELDATETWTYTATYLVTAANVTNGNTITNFATFSNDQAASQSSSASTTMPPPVFPCSGDNFPGNSISGASGTTVCDNVGATAEGGEPNVSGLGGINSIWYSWTAPATGSVTFETCSADTTFDTTLGVYTGGSVGGLTPIGTNDDATGCPSFRSQLTLPVTAGNTYRIQLDGYNNNTGDFRLDWNMVFPLAAITKNVDMSSISAPGTLTYSIIVDNTGTQDLTSPSLADTLTQNAAARTLTSGPTLTSGDTDSDGVLDTAETWLYTVTYAVTASDIINGNDLLNDATFSSTEAADVSDDATTSIIGTPAMTITKTASAPGFVTGNVANAPAGTVVTYTYVVTNTGNVIIDDVSIADSHNGAATAPSPSGEELTNDAGTSGDSTDPSGYDGNWDFLGPGDQVTFTATYVVQQEDVNTLQ